MVDNRFLPKLSQNLLEILEDDEYCDIILKVGNDPYVKIFRAHMVILNYRSPHLREILSSHRGKTDGTLVHIKLPNILLIYQTSFEDDSFSELQKYCTDLMSKESDKLFKLNFSSISENLLVSL